jgi:hypothetical protein
LPSSSALNTPLLERGIERGLGRRRVLVVGGAGAGAGVGVGLAWPVAEEDGTGMDGARRSAADLLLLLVAAASAILVRRTPS